MKEFFRAFLPGLSKTIIAVSIFTGGFVVPAQAQNNNLTPQQMAAVMSIINMYLLDSRLAPIPEPEGEKVNIAPEDGVLAQSYAVDQSQAWFAAFDLQSEGMEFCLDIVANQALAEGDIVVEVNGVAALAVEGKDNCYQISEPDQREINYITLQVINPAVTLTLDRIELASTEQTQLTLGRLTRGEWDNAAVRKVLKIFAFGGHARDQQIQDWADMYPQDAILEMLHFGEQNLKLSPLAEGETYIDHADPQNPIGTLYDWANYISDEASNLPIAAGNRESLGLGGGNFDDGYNRMITVRGLNPFRQRIGFWETNYHLATNLDASVSRVQMAAYYDFIMSAHEIAAADQNDLVSYQHVLGVAAKSAAVAMQYGHRNNRWNEATGECNCNDDFAREIHQLFYGIFGEGDPDHEDVTIPETAKLLTDMPVHFISGFGFDVVVDFQTDDHHTAPVTIFGQPVAGADASEKIDALMPLSMHHPESLQNLPVMIISVLADDNLNEARKQQIRAAWADLGQNKDFLHFIQSYAISDLLHGPNHVKYFTTHERALYLANKNNLDNLEAFYGGAGTGNGNRAGRTVGSIITEDFAGDFFKPLHNVFGGQTSLEASDSSGVFEKNFNRLTDDEHHLRNSVVCADCDSGQPWEKKWPDVLPQRADGEYYVEDVAPWLWRHVVGNMDNYTELERAHLYALLGAARIDPADDNNADFAHDLNYVMCIIADYQFTENATDAPIIDILTGGTWNDYCRRTDDGGSFLPHELDALNAVLTGEDIANDPEIQSILTQLGSVTLPLEATEGLGSGNVPDGGANMRKHARERVSSALGFIYTTPFVFAEGR
ncbi:MAG: hypothetical protein HKN50_09140 [Gammaproteobacteria bacterium]|nr:hypothetical protein [Gammaproteobacteria bacterium]